MSCVAVASCWEACSRHLQSQYGYHSTESSDTVELNSHQKNCLVEFANLNVLDNLNDWDSTCLPFFFPSSSSSSLSYSSQISPAVNVTIQRNTPISRHLEAIYQVPILPITAPLPDHTIHASLHATSPRPICHPSRQHSERRKANRLAPALVSDQSIGRNVTTVEVFWVRIANNINLPPIYNGFDRLDISQSLLYQWKRSPISGANWRNPRQHAPPWPCRSSDHLLCSSGPRCPFSFWETTSTTYGYSRVLRFVSLMDHSTSKLHLMLFGWEYGARLLKCKVTDYFVIKDIYTIVKDTSHRTDRILSLLQDRPLGEKDIAWSWFGGSIPSRVRPVHFWGMFRSCGSSHPR